jgi:hypothetical protein
MVFSDPDGKEKEPNLPVGAGNYERSNVVA